MQLFVLALLPIAAIVILIVLIAKTTSNSTRIGTLEWEIKKLHDLEHHVNELSISVDELRKHIEGWKQPPLRKKEVEKAAMSAEQAAQPSVPTPSVATPTSAPKQRVVPAPTPSRTREEWEALIGGKLLNRIGALALIIGIGFFLKYAFDNDWIGETTRVLLGALFGLACLAGGYRTNKRGFQIFAQGLVGAGIAILYLSVYAAFNFYQLVPQWVAFVLMAIVTVIAFLSGLYYGSLAEGILGWAGGFLTPILLSTGQANEVGLFTYLVLLDAGLVAMVMKKDQWAILEPLAFVGTWLMYVMWRSEYYTDGDLWLTIFFVTAFWVLFLLPDVVRSRKATAGDRFRQAVPVLNALFYFLAMYFLIDTNNHGWMGLATLLMGVASFSVVVVQQRRGNLRDEFRARYTLTALAFLVIATAIQFSDFDTVIFWSLEAAALIWFSGRWKERYLQTAALVLFGCTVFKLLFLTGDALAYSPIRSYVLLFNHRTLSFAILVGSLGFSAFTVDRSAGVEHRRISDLLHFAWCLVLLLLVSAEVYDFFRFKMLDQLPEIQGRLSYFRFMTFAVVWITVSLPLAWVGLKKKLAPVMIGGLACALLAVVFVVVKGIAFEPIDSFLPVVNIRAISLLLVATGLLLHSQFMQKAPDAFDWSKDLIGFVQAGTALVVFVLLTGETRDFFQRDIASLMQQEAIPTPEVRHLTNLQQMWLSGIWLLYSGALMAAGIWRKHRGMRLIAIALFGIAILKIFIYDLSFLETVYRIVSFVALGALLIAVSYAYQKYKDIIGGKA